MTAAAAPLAYAATTLFEQKSPYAPATAAPRRRVSRERRRRLRLAIAPQLRARRVPRFG